MTDILKSYLATRAQLHQERTTLESRLQEIDRVLGSPATATIPARAAKVTRARIIPTRKIQPARTGQKRLSLSQAVVQVTTGHPQTKAEIIQAVQDAGYRFITKTPLKSLNPVLYGSRPRFMRQDGKFSPAAGAGSPARARQPKRRTMSPAARARISAAAKARWAKRKAAGKNRL